MRYKILTAIICLVLLLGIFGCKQTEETTTGGGEETPEKTISEEKAETPETPKTPVEEPEETKEEAKPSEKEMTAEVKELLTKHEKLKSMAYNYRGPDKPDDVYRFAIKGNKVKLVLPGSKYLQEDEYNAIYFDTQLKTAEAYCDDNLLCKTKGKKKDLDYDKNYIETSIDWINKVTYAEKLEEILIEDRPTWKLNTTTGIISVEAYYGVPYEVKSEGKTYTFRDVVFNSVQDSEVIPS